MLETIKKLKSKQLKVDFFYNMKYQKQYFNVKFNSTGRISIALSGSIVFKDIYDMKKGHNVARGKHTFHYQSFN